MLKMKDVLNGMVSQAERGEAAFYAFGDGLMMRVKWMPSAGQMQVTLERERIMPSNTEMDTVTREMGALGGWEEVNEAGPDWAGYLCRRYIWFVKGGG